MAKKGESMRGEGRKKMGDMSKNICPECSKYGGGHMSWCTKKVHPNRKGQ